MGVRIFRRGPARRGPARHRRTRTRRWWAGLAAGALSGGLILPVSAIPASAAETGGTGAAARQSTLPTTATHFTFTTASGNTVGDSAYIDNAQTNGEVGLMLFVTPNFDPFGVCGCTYDNSPIGVWYDPTLREWAIFNENGAAMPQRMSFNVLVLPVTFVNHTTFVMSAITANTTGDYTLVENSTADGNPNAKLQVTQNWNPGSSDPGSGGVYNPHPIGVFYDTAAHLWAIFNEDGAPMTIGASFNVLVNTSKRNGGGKVALQRATKANTSGDSTYINNPLTNGDFANIVLATPNFNPGGRGGVYNTAPLGVWYPTSGPQEAVFDQNGAAPPLQSAYNLLIWSS